MSYVIGIDPGKKGGVALLDGDGDLREVSVVPMDAEGDYDPQAAVGLLVRLAQVVRSCWPSVEIVVGLENMGPAGGKLAGGNANYWRGYSAGAWLWASTALGLPVERVHPRGWQNRWKIAGDDAAALAVACRLWPGMSWLATTRSKVPHMGLVEAALVGEHVRLLRLEREAKVKKKEKVKA